MVDGKTIIITGGSSGVGLKLSERFIGGGANLVLIARNKEKLLEAKQFLEGVAVRGNRVHVISCDVSDYPSVQDAFKESADMAGLPDMLINSAGILREGYVDDQDVSTFREIMDINFFGTLHGVKAILPYFGEKGGGRIVNISSIAGLMGVFGYSAYCAAKHAVTGLTSSLRVELKPRNIKVHLVCPPEFDSPMVDELNENRTIENKVMAQTIPVLSADVVADAVIEGIEKERYEIITGRTARIIATCDRLFPGVSRRVSDFRVGRVYKGPSTL